MGSSAQTIPCAPSHHRYTQCVCVVVYWQLPDIIGTWRLPLPLTLYVYDSWTTQADTYLHCIVYCIFILCILSPVREGCHGQGFCIIYSPFFNCLGVYFIVRGSGSWARGRSFRLLYGPTVSRAVGDFE